MSPKNTSLTVRLMAAGLFGPASLLAIARAQEPAPRAVAASPAPTQSVLLLYNGRVVQGQLSEDDRGYVLKQRLGAIHFPKADVEKIFGSLEAVYQYKKSRLAQGDPDEHMKLARWCLAMKMTGEARAQLQAVQNLSPDFGEAKAMLAKLDAETERGTQADPGIVQVGGGSLGETPAEPVPARGNRRRAVLGLPEIFDLPPALAVRRTQEFARYVHPQLQKHCAGCHNERTGSSFQLVEARGQRELNDDYIIRTNMEATLRLVDPSDLAHSSLLTTSLMPHKPKNQPILPSPKSPAYRYFEGWVYSLRPPQPPTTDRSAAGASTAAASEAPSGFASDRLPQTGLTPPPSGSATTGSALPLPQAPGRPNTSPGIPPGPSPGTLTPTTLPPVQSGAGSASATTSPPLPGRAMDDQAVAPAGLSTRRATGLPTANARPGAPVSQDGSTQVPPLPGAQTESASASTQPAKPSTPKKTRRRSTIDPTTLEKFLMNRGQTGPN